MPRTLAKRPEPQVGEKDVDRVRGRQTVLTLPQIRQQMVSYDKVLLGAIFKRVEEPVSLVLEVSE